MKFKFTPKMFMNMVDYSFQDMADYAQDALDKHLESLPKVTGYVYPGTDCFMDDVETQDTHTAVLFNLEPIEKPECEHLKVGFAHPNLGGYILCLMCNKHLKPKTGWEVIK